MDKRKNGDGTIVDLWAKNGNKKGLKYQCRILCSEKDDNGKAHYVYANGRTIDEARRRCKEKAEIFNAKQVAKRTKYGNNVSVNAKDVLSGSLDKFFDYCADDRKWSAYTRITREYEIKAIRDRIGSYQIKDITPVVINNLFSELLSEYNRQTVGKMYSFLGDYFEWLEDNDVIVHQKNPFPLAKRLPKRSANNKVVGQKEYLDKKKKGDDSEEYIFDEDEMKRLISFADEHYYQFDEMKDSLSARNRNREQYRTYYYQIVVFIFLTGIRGGEMQALTMNDIDFKKHHVKIRNAVTYKAEVLPKPDGTEYKEGEKKKKKRKIVVKETKSEAGKRTIGISAQVEKYLKRIIKLRPDQECPLLLCTSKGTVVDKRRFERKFDDLLNWSDIKKKGRSIHALRHTFISFAIDHNEMSPLADESDLFISGYVGHKSLDITYRVYTHISKGKIKRVNFNKEIKISSWEWDG